MAIDTRDWHKDNRNKREGYTERAPFRLGHGEVVRRKHAASWRRNLLAVACVVAALVAVAVLR